MADYSRSLGININLWWGLVVMLFGAVMFLVAYRKRLVHPQSDRGRA
jgi:hypothetical protein